MFVSDANIVSMRRISTRAKDVTVGANVVSYTNKDSNRDEIRPLATIDVILIDN